MELFHWKLSTLSAFPPSSTEDICSSPRHITHRLCVSSGVRNLWHKVTHFLKRSVKLLAMSDTCWTNKRLLKTKKTGNVHYRCPFIHYFWALLHDVTGCHRQMNWKCFHMCFRQESWWRHSPKCPPGGSVQVPTIDCIKHGHSVHDVTRRFLKSIFWSPKWAEPNVAICQHVGCRCFYYFFFLIKTHNRFVLLGKASVLLPYPGLSFGLCWCARSM